MSLKNKRVLITSGPTWVPLDCMRVISNCSTGELGNILARELQKEGAKVTVLEGPVLKPLQRSKDMRIVKYFFYDELSTLLKKEIAKHFDVVIHAAAVSDYQLRKPQEKKMRSGLREVKLTLVPTQKIISIIKKISPKTFLVGFKLEAAFSKGVSLKKATSLFKEAQCDLVVANSIRNGRYSGCLINRDKKILACAKSRAEMAQNLIKILKGSL